MLAVLLGIDLTNPDDADDVELLVWLLVRRALRQAARDGPPPQPLRLIPGGKSS